MKTDMHTLDPFRWIADPYEHITRLRGGGYRTACRLVIHLPAFADGDRPCVRHGGVSLDPCGALRISADWWFDGASGPSIDTSTNIMAAMVHDALYWLRKNVRRSGISRSLADRTFAQILKAQGMGKIRRWYHWGAVRALGWLFAVLVLVVSGGCVNVDIHGDLNNRCNNPSIYGVSSNACPDTVNFETLNEGGNADLESHITGAKLH